MTEIFTEIKPEVKEMAETIWNIATVLDNPVLAANFLNDATNYCKTIFNEQEIDFLHFYFNMQMEMMQ